MFWTVHPIGWLSLRHLVVFFLELWSGLSGGPFFFFWDWHGCYFKGRSLRCSPGWGNAGCCAVMLYVGEGPRVSSGACSTLLRISVIPCATHNQTGPLWCWFPSGWACARPRPLWVSSTTSPMRLGVSPAATPTTDVFNQRFEASFPPCWSPGLWGLLRSPPFVRFICARVWGRHVLPAALPAPFSATLSPALSVYLWATVGPQGLLVLRLPAPFVPHSASLGPPRPCESSPPCCPVSTPATGLDECLVFISSVSDFLAVVQFSVSSGCVRRRSVSTYAAILILVLFHRVFIIFILFWWSNNDQWSRRTTWA